MAAAPSGSRSAFPVLSETWADDVDLVEARDPWIAWTRAELAREQIWLSRCDGATWSEPMPLIADGASRSFRPALTALAGRVLLLGCARGAHGYGPAGLVVAPGGAGHRFAIPSEGQVFHIALASGNARDRAWVAWEERRGAASRLRVGRIDVGGRVEEHALAESDASRRSPALGFAEGSAWLAWVETDPKGRGAVQLLRLEEDEAPRPIATSPFHQEAPFVATSDRGPVIAWHEAVPADGRPDVIRWIRVAGLDGEDPVGGPPPLLAPERRSAGEDQGWEFPSLAQDAEGRWWLAGRSSHGWHLASRPPSGSWSDLRPLSDGTWGGRGRRGVLRRTETHGVLFARREPQGIVVETAVGAGQPLRRTAHGGGGAPRETSVDLDEGATREGRPILFGDLHQHTAHSDGLGSLEELLLHARRFRGLDFAAVSDHDRFCRRALGPATWDFFRSVVDAHNEPGKFVTFLAYEFTGPRHPGPGHKCVYFGDRAPDRVPDKDVERLFAVLREHGGIAVPHHVGWTGADVAHHDPELQPVWEICSVHGCYEAEGAPTAFPAREDPKLPGHFAKDALDAGLRFGFIGSTDSHGLLWHHGIARKRNPFSTGLAAVLDAEPTRVGILGALKARRCYATTGARIQLRVNLDGAPMGSELPAGTEGKLHVEAKGTGPIARVARVSREGEVVIGDGPDGTATIEVPVRASARPWDYHYVRVEQDDGEAAWSSPIWIG